MHIGGLVGVNMGTVVTPSTVLNCYATGSVSGTGEIGGLVGWNHDADIFASFWDTETSGEADGVGLVSGTGTVEVYGRTTSQMQTQSTFTDYGWDFVNIWRIDEGVSYPYLRCFITYTDIGLRLYDGTETVTIACEPEGTVTSPLRIAKNGTVYGVVLVEPGDPLSSGIVIQTGSGAKAVAKLE